MKNNFVTISDDAKNFLTEEELEEADALEDEFAATVNKTFTEYNSRLKMIIDGRESGDVTAFDLINIINNKLGDISERMAALSYEGERRYIADRNGDRERILADAWNNIQAISYLFIETPRASISSADHWRPIVKGEDKTAVFYHDEETGYDLTFSELKDQLFVLYREVEVQDMALCDKEYKVKGGNRELLELCLQRLKELYAMIEANYREYEGRNRDGSIGIQKIGNPKLKSRCLEGATIESIFPEISGKKNVNCYVLFGIKDKPRQKKTRAKAGIISSVPSHLALITQQEDYHQLALSYTDKGECFIAPINEEKVSMENLEFKNGLLYFKGVLQPLSTAQISDIRSKQPVQNLPITYLNLFYSIILQDFKKSIDSGDPLRPTKKIFLPELAKRIGLDKPYSEETKQTVVSITKSFHTFLGKTIDGEFMVMNFEGYDESDNTISFSSPYLNHLVETIWKVSIRTNKKGEQIVNKKKKVLTDASHTYLVRTELASALDLAAAENVKIIVTLIEQSGFNTPHISVKTLIDRNPLFAEKIERDSNKTRVMQKTFAHTWKYLRKYTELEKAYNDIILPSEKDPAALPGSHDLDMVFQFPHKGKKQH